ncbi:MAG: Na/Pi cotransporter family protein [Muribaculaceae bacterium]|nr:Na/Pi cotransporter family protein [Muribaculaceae bacterium]
MWFLVVKMIGALAILVFGMIMMSESLQKMSGPHLRHTLSAMTSNRFAGVFSGMLITVAVQSSSATTVMTVSFVNAQLLSLAQAISVIMGANIGTTLTAWIMSAGFSFNVVDLVWPVFVIGVILIYNKKHRIAGDLLFGVAFLFLSLGLLSATGKEMDLAHNATLVNFFSSFDTSNYLSIIIFLAIGTILTCIVQSSAALMAITMILCTSGALSIYLGIALVMGENIGTTLTANLAAMTGNVQARRAALAHLVFNVVGVIWVLAVFYPFVNMSCNLVGLSPEAANPNPMKLSFALATFHTCFNVLNTLLLIWFIPQIEWLVCKLLKDKEDVENESEYQFKYINAGLVQTPEIAVLQAQREVKDFGKHVQDMFNRARMLTVLIDTKDFEKEFNGIEADEDKADKIEFGIAQFLAQVSEAHVSSDTKSKIRSMNRQIDEIESIGDSCFSLARKMKRLHDNGEKFNEIQHEDLKQMMDLVETSLTQMNLVIGGRRENVTSMESLNIENKINKQRNSLKSKNLKAMDEQKTTYSIGTLFNDIVEECEQLADYVINVVEARLLSDSSMSVRDFA